ncbi:hypothetical protein PAXINDRAFT_96771 [Paxillus involutus ATCC 200175]|nr:hypothetical protein PAXINDRAFT_96771 [Paxillus involutus ATCC 200175]
MTVAKYFKSLLNRPLRFPDNICISTWLIAADGLQVDSGALPLELCMVPPGQIMRKQVPPEQTNDVLVRHQKASRAPPKQLAMGFRRVLAYGQSEYVRQFGMTVDETAGPLTLAAPQSFAALANSTWNMINKHFFRPAAIERWAAVAEVMAAMKSAVRVNDTAPLVAWRNGQGRINEVNLYMLSHHDAPRFTIAPAVRLSNLAEKPKLKSPQPPATSTGTWT